MKRNEKRVRELETQMQFLYNERYSSKLEPNRLFRRARFRAYTLAIIEMQEEYRELNGSYFVHRIIDMASDETLGDL